MAMTLKEFKKSSFRVADYFKDIKTQEDVDALAVEIRALGATDDNPECLYEFCTMEGFDPDDVRKLIY